MTETDSAPRTASVEGVTVDIGRMHRDRVARAQRALADSDIAAALLFHPMNVRYVSFPGGGTVASMQITFRWALVPAEGKVQLWDYTGHFSEGGDEATREAEPAGGVPPYFTGDVHPVHGFSFFPQGSMVPESVHTFAADVVDVLSALGLKGEKLGIDRAETTAFLALQSAGIEICDVQGVIEGARSVKTVDELEMLRANARTTALGIDALRAQLQPGVTENELWGTMMGTVMSHGAEWSNTRLLSSGQRTNPWAQEATDKVVEAGELVGLDTDLSGRWGYFTDISRTFLCGDVDPTDEQRRLYQQAYEFVYANIPEMRPGASYAELGERLKQRLPEQYREQRYPFIAHGVGVSDEYPAIKWDFHHDGELEVGMCLSVEAYHGEVGGSQGVKFEEQIIVTDDGPEIISDCISRDERLLG
jgi:Xaa-Pro dipeptidase